MTSTRQAFARQEIRTSAFSLVELLVVIGIIGILAALLLPVLGRAKSKARSIACVNQLKQLGVAARLYAEDNGSRLPAAELLPSNPTDPQHSLPRISEILGSYVSKAAGTNVSAQVFKCPADNDWFFEAEGSSYQWNAGLNGKRIDFGEKSQFGLVIASNGNVFKTNGSITRATEATPLLLDYDDFHPRLPKSGKNVVYMDGHATTFSAPPVP